MCIRDRRGGRLALCAGRKRRQLADVASADVLLRFDVRAHRDAHAPARRDGGIRLLLAPCAGDARPRRRKDEGIRLSDRDEILGVAAGAETQGGIDHLRRTPRGHLQDERRHLPRSVLRRAGTPAAQNQGREKSIEYEN